MKTESANRYVWVTFTAVAITTPLQTFVEVVAHETFEGFSANAGVLNREDWSTLPIGVIEGQTIRGVHYTHDNAFGNLLAVKPAGGWNFRLGVQTATSYSSFGSSDRMTLNFGPSGVSDFGMMFAQGNYTDTGTSIFAIQVDGGAVFQRSIPIVTAGPNLGYLGLTGLNGANSISIWQIQSGANAVWSTTAMDWAIAPTPSGLSVVVAGSMLTGLRRKRFA